MLKSDLRAELIQKLKAADRESRSAAATALALSWLKRLPSGFSVLGSADTIALYRARKSDEFPYEETLAEALQSRGFRIAFPEILDVPTGRMRMVSVNAPWPWIWKEGEKGTEVLDGPGTEVIEPHRLRAIVVPGLGFTRGGHRLGRGAGFYDRYLSLAPQAIRVGLAQDFQIVPALPLEPTDQPLDWILTPTQDWRVFRPEIDPLC